MKLEKFFCLLMLVVSIQLVKGQCGTEPITDTDWCENTKAKWEFDAPTPGASYIWYNYIDLTTLTAANYDANGLLIPDSFISKYDSTTSTEFYSPFRIKQATQGTSIELTYQKIIRNTVNEYNTTTFTPKAPGAVFEVTFDATESVRLNSVQVPVQLTSPTQQYKIQVSFGSLAGPGSAVYEFSALSATSLGGNNYMVKIPVNYTIAAGAAQKLVINTNPTGSTANQVDNLLFSNTQITPSTGEAITFGANAAAADAGAFSVAYDWDYTLVCEPLNSGESDLTTVGCCIVPASDGILVLNRNKEIIDEGNENVDLEIVGGATGSYYAWYLDGVLIPSASGTNETNYSSNQAGVYEVREITDPSRVSTDLENPGCYSKSTVEIQDKLIELTEDSAPTNTPLCIGDQYVFSATGASSLTWGATNGILSSTTASTVTYTGGGTGSGQVTVTGSVVSGNKVIGGDFEGVSSTVFQTELSEGTIIASADGSFTITDEIISQNNSDWDLDKSQSNFTGNTGDFLLINDGRNMEEAKILVWGQQATGITPGQEYTFSFDMTSVTWVVSAENDYTKIKNGDITAPYQDIVLEAYVNGQLVGEANTDFATNGYNSVHNWKTYSFPWTAGPSDTDVALEIRWKSLPGNGGNVRGYDYGIDNISFGGLVSQTLVADVGPFTDCSDLTTQQSICNGDEKTLTAIPTGGMVFSHWEDEDGNVIAETETVTVSPLTPTTYTAVGYTALGNVLDNGSFENGLTGFDYGAPYYNGTYNGTIGGFQEEFTITENTSAGNGAWVQIGPRPGSTGTWMLVADAKQKEPVVGWKFNVANAGDVYQLEGWIGQQHGFIDQVSNLPSKVGVSIIPSSATPSVSDPVIDSYDLPRENDWFQVKSQWVAPASGEYTFYIRNLETSNGGGNDFSLDDFTLYPLVANSRAESPILVENCACDPVDTVMNTYCGLNGTFIVEDKYPTPGGTYEWYETPTSLTAVTGTTAGTYPNVEFTTTLSNATETLTDSIYSLYLVDETITNPTILPALPSGCNIPTSNDNLEKYVTKLVVFKDVTLNSINAFLKGYNSGLTNSNITINFYGSSGNNPDKNVKLIPEKTSAVSFNTPDQNGPFQEVTIPINQSLSGSSAGTIYWLEVKASNVSQGPLNCSTTLPLGDDLGGNSVQIGAIESYSTLLSNNTGSFYKYVFEKAANPACPRVEVQVRKQCPPCNKPQEVAISNTDPVSQCNGTNLDLEGGFTDGGNTIDNSTGDMQYVWYKKGTTPTASAYSAVTGTTAGTKNIASLTQADSAIWYLRVEDGTSGNKACYTEDSVMVRVNPLPTATITDGQKVCDDGSAESRLPITLTGTANWEIDYTDAEGNPQTMTAITTADTAIRSAVAGTYTLTSVEDGNGCVNAITGQTAEFEYLDTVIVSYALQCDDVNMGLAPNQFQIRLEVAKGDLPTIAISENTSTGVSFNEPSSGSGIWISDPINEEDTLDISITDVNDCKGGVVLEDLNQKCSCPIRIDSAVFLQDSICAEGTTDLNIYYKGATSGNYNITVTPPTATDLTAIGESGPSTSFTSVSEEGTYQLSVEGVDDACSVNATIDLAYYEKPEATLSGGKSICAVDSSALLTVTLTAGKSPFTIDVAGAESHSLNSGDEAPFNSDTVSVNTAGTYTLDNLTDANGCITVAADLPSTTTITTITPPTATITDPSVRELSISEATTAYTVTATPPVAPAYVGSWSAAGMGDFNVDAGNGELSNLNQTVEDDGKPAATSVVVWKVDDADGVCPSAIDTVDIVRRKLTKPNAENDTLCLTPTNGVFTLVPLNEPNTTNGETAEWIAVGSSPAASMNTSTYALQTTFTERGEYTYRYKISNTSVNASDYIDIVIVVDSVPNISSAQLVGDDYGCQDTTKFYEITGAINADTYRWDIPTGFTAKTLNNTTASDSLIFSGTTSGIVEIFASNEVCGENSTPVALAINDIRLKPQDTPVIDGLSPVCENTPSAKYGASSTDADTYTWNWGSIEKLSKVAVADSLELVASDFAGKTSGIITVLPVNSCGANANRAGTVTVTIDPIVTPSVSLSSNKTNNLFCLEDPSVEFTATPVSGQGDNPLYEFKVLGSAPSVPIALTKYTAPITQDKTIMQVIMYSDAACRSKDTAQAFVEMREVVPAIVNVTQKDEVCFGESVTIALQVQPSIDPTATIKWFNNGVEESDKSGQQFTISNTGSYSYKATYATNICNVAQETGEVEVTIWEQPIIDFSSFLVEQPLNVKVDTKESTTNTFTVSILGIANDPVTYDWKGEGVVDQTQKDVTITYAPNQEGYFDYSLVVSNTNFMACFDEASFEILAAVALSIPNAFSPNGDQVNDRWEIPGIGRYPEAVVKVFNRWGNLVDERKINNDGPWDGSGSPVGTYYYIINLQSEVITSPLTGAVNIVR